MKLTKTRLKRMIKEEARAALKEKAGFFGRMLGLEQDDAEEAIKALDDFQAANTTRFWNTVEKAEAVIDQADALRTQYGDLRYRENTPDGDQREMVSVRLKSVGDIQRAATDQLIKMSDDRQEQQRLKAEQEERDRAREREEEDARYDADRAAREKHKREYHALRGTGRDAYGPHSNWEKRGGFDESKMRISKSRLQKLIREEFKRLQK